MIRTGPDRRDRSVTSARMTYREPMDWVAAARLRPGMYIGSTGAAGAAHLLYDVVNNSLDQFLAGDVTTISVTIDGDTATVSDDGPGLPFDVVTLDGWSLAEDHCIRRHDSRSVDDHAPHVHLLSGGAGLAIVNALSSEMEVVSAANGGGWQQRFSRGAALTEPTRIDPPFARGVSVRFTLDREAIFTKGEGFPVEKVRTMLSNAVHLFPGVVIECNGERFGPSGLAGLLPNPTDDDVVVDATEGDVRVLFAAPAPWAQRSDPSTRISSWVNGAATTEHGDHVAGLNDVFAERRWWPSTALLHVIMYSPEFAGPTRGCLHAPRVRVVVADILRRELPEYLRH